MSKQYTFEAQTERLLELLTHSIYSNKDIFLRELISNASDAIDKARIRSLTDTEYLEDDTNFEIRITSDEENHIITIEDNGIGMTRDEVVANIGTIAKSGTKDFLEKLEKTKDENSLIGQFGVGFYSVFMVAEKVELETKSFDSKTSVIWISEGKGTFELSDGKRKKRGTKITIFLKKDESEYAKNYKLRELIKKHSNYIGVPIMLPEYQDPKEKKEEKFSQVNETKAIWNKQKSEITDEEYKNFYQSVSMDFTDPLAHIHTKTEGNVSYTALLYIPMAKNMFLGSADSQTEYGPKLFVQNVMILEKAALLLPVWLRFVSWVVQTSDIPLNISREMLQGNPNTEKIKKSLTKKIIDTLKKELINNRENYENFLGNFGNILKEGIYYEIDLKEEIAGTITFYSLLENKKITLDEYLKKAQEEKKDDKNIKKIYFITAKSLAEAKANPYIDQFQKKNIDVLLLVDPIDEWLTGSLTSYWGNPLISITGKDVELEVSEEEKKQQEEKAKEYKDLFELIKNTIGSDTLEAVQPSTRLGDHVWALATKDGQLSIQMEKMMRAMGQEVPPQKRTLELNPDHKIVALMFEEFQSDLKSEKLKNLIWYVYEQALLLEWWELSDYRAFVERMNQFIVSK